MNSKKKILLLSVTCLATCVMAASQAVPEWLTLNDSLRADRLLTLAWGNPAVNQFSRGCSDSRVGVGMSVHDEHGDAPLDARLGDYSRLWNLAASTHMKHKTSTLWGFAKYENGFTRGVTWNETSDLELVYPFILADSVTSARLKSERYSFGGGYADGNGRFYWGASINYAAGLHYRRVDPRPRNITACLDVAAGVGVRVLKDHVAALSINFRKYKQTNNVAFYSELGHDKLFHLTGLTNDYGRFAGTGESTYYNGYRWGMTANVHPLHARGLSATLSASRFSVDNILTSLNKLPMAHVAHNELNAELGWLERNWGLRLIVDASRRVGRENVFGDAASSVYPKIGDNDMYHENRFRAGADASWSSMVLPTLKLDVMPRVSYNHVNEIYADPQCRRLLNAIEWGTRLSARWHARRFMPGVALGTTLYHPVESEWLSNGVKAELGGLERVLESNYHYLSNFHSRCEAMLSLQVAVNSRQAVRLNCGGVVGNYQDGLHTFDLTTSLNYIF